MTKDQYKKYKKIESEAEPVRWFLLWCGDRYKDKTLAKCGFNILTKAKNFFLQYDLYGELKTTDIPIELQERIVKTIEDWVEEKEDEMKNI